MTATQVLNTDYTVRAKKYAKRVVDGKIPACAGTKQACQRYLNDLKRKDWKFDKDRANRVCRFAELMPYIDGPKAKEPFVLEDWQVWLICNIFGFIDPKTGLRRFKRAHVWVAKGNGKTLLGSLLGLYMAFMDNEMSAEAFAFARTREQARLSWMGSKSMMLFAPEIAKKLGVEVGQHALVQTRSNSSFKALSAEANAQHGLRPHFLLIDELHVVDAELWHVLEAGLTKRTQPILLTISTAGFDLSSIGYTIFEYCQRILEGREDADRTFTVIYQAESDKLDDIKELRKAHPNLGVSVHEDELLDQAKKAQAISQERNKFITLQLNRWVNAREAWLQMDKWNACGDRTIRLEDFRGRPAFIGLDMSQRNDITGKAYVFVDSDEIGRKVYTVFTKSYIPEATVDSAKNASYSGWVQDGHLIQVDGETIDFHQVEQDLVQDCEDFPGSTILYDPQFMFQMAQNLAARGITAAEVRPTIANFNPAMKELEASVYEQRLVHEGNPCTAWQVGNITVKPNASGMVYPAKPQSNAKIDVGYAILTALHMAMKTEVYGGAMLFKVLGA